MNLYYISAPDPSGADSLDAFVHANTEMSAHYLWLTHCQDEGRIPADELSPNYDLYLVPHDPLLPSRGIEGVLPWSLDGTGGTGGGTVQLISSSWINRGPTVRKDGSVWDSSAGVWRKPDDPSDEAATIFAVEALISAAATGEPVDPAVMALARSALAVLQNVLDDGG